jgi:hypothetical protein
MKPARWVQLMVGRLSLEDERTGRARRQSCLLWEGRGWRSGRLGVAPCSWPLAAAPKPVGGGRRQLSRL